MSESVAARPSGEREYVPYRVVDVLNFGGFFGGETVTLDATPLLAPGPVASFIIPEHLFDNLTDRHKIAAGIALGLVLDGGEVRAARVLAAPTREQLRDIVKQPPHEDSGPGPRALMYRCGHCDLWVAGTPDQHSVGGYFCRICGQKLG